MFARPCSMIVDVRELLGSESKLQVYAYTHNLLGSIKENISKYCVSFEWQRGCTLGRVTSSPKLPTIKCGVVIDYFG